MAIVLGVIVAVIGAVVLVLALGGPEVPTEQRGDLTYIDGVTPEDRPGGNLVASIADIASAEVIRDGPELVFTAEVAAPIPQRLRVSALGFRWEIAGDVGPKWTLALAIGPEEEVSLFSDAGFGVGTVDDTFPGGVSIEGTKVEVRMEPDGVEAFPKSFEWSLAASLRAFRHETDSPRVEDRFPDQGTQDFKN